MLNWEPKVQLRDGLLKTIMYFERVMEGTGSALQDA
jgi:hypothetical protein